MFTLSDLIGIHVFRSRSFAQKLRGAAILGKEMRKGALPQGVSKLIAGRSQVE